METHGGVVDRPNRLPQQRDHLPVQDDRQDMRMRGILTMRTQRIPQRKAWTDTADVTHPSNIEPRGSLRL